MRRSIAVGTCVALGIALLPRLGIAQSCVGYPIDTNASVDGVLLYRMGAQKWQELPLGNQLPHAGPVQFVYVAKETWDRNGRSGVVIIKTGSTTPTARPGPHQNQVLLARSGQMPNGTCGPISRFLPRHISATSYDQYHELGARVPPSDKASLDAFHIHYLGYGDSCRDTNNVSWDSPLRWDFRSNRSQFSFDPNVVRNGMGQVMSSLGVGSAAAGTLGLSNARVTIRRYRTEASNLVCIPFALNVLGPGYFLRIDDLDASQQAGIFFRTYEKAWQLTP